MTSRYAIMSPEEARRKEAELEARHGHVDTGAPPLLVLAAAVTGAFIAFLLTVAAASASNAALGVIAILFAAPFALAPLYKPLPRLWQQLSLVAGANLAGWAPVLSASPWWVCLLAGAGCAALLAWQPPPSVRLGVALAEAAAGLGLALDLGSPAGPLAYFAVGGLAVVFLQDAWRNLQGWRFGITVAAGVWLALGLVHTVLLMATGSVDSGAILAAGVLAFGCAAAWLGLVRDGIPAMPSMGRVDAPSGAPAGQRASPAASSLPALRAKPGRGSPGQAKAAKQDKAARAKQAATKGWGR